MNVKYFDTKEAALEFVDGFVSRPDMGTSAPAAVELADGTVKWQITIHYWSLD